jgi:hypothetical protein
MEKSYKKMASYEKKVNNRHGKMVNITNSF